MHTVYVTASRARKVDFECFNKGKVSALDMVALNCSGRTIGALGRLPRMPRSPRWPRFREERKAQLLFLWVGARSPDRQLPALGTNLFWMPIWRQGLILSA